MRKSNATELDGRWTKRIQTLKACLNEDLSCSQIAYHSLWTRYDVNKLRNSDRANTLRIAPLNRVWESIRAWHKDPKIQIHKPLARNRESAMIFICVVRHPGACSTVIEARRDAHQSLFLSPFLYFPSQEKDPTSAVIRHKNHLARTWLVSMHHHVQRSS